MPSQTSHRGWHRIQGSYHVSRVDIPYLDRYTIDDSQFAAIRVVTRNPYYWQPFGLLSRGQFKQAEAAVTLLENDRVAIRSERTQAIPANVQDCLSTGQIPKNSLGDQEPAVRAKS